MSKSRQKDVTPARLNFDSGDDNEEKVDYEPSTEEEESEGAEYELPKNENTDLEASPTRSVGVFDRIGRKLTNKDLRYKFDITGEKSHEGDSRNHQERSHSITQGIRSRRS